LQPERYLSGRPITEHRRTRLPEHIITATIAFKPLACKLLWRVDFADRIGGIIKQGFDFQKNSTPQDHADRDVIARDPGKSAAIADEAF
jgi:hypothetical protein